MNESEANLNVSKKCPQCGVSLPMGALDGLCPACLLKQGAVAETATEHGGAPFQPPSVDEISRLFPQLEILAFIGKGGMGAVYKARQPALDRIVALKILPSQAANGPGFSERFNREARALAKLNHPNIVAVHEFGQVRSRRRKEAEREEADQAESKTSPPPHVGGYQDKTSGLPFFIMEFVDGLNLRQLERAGKLSPREALQIVPQICEALQFAHDEGIVHRDIKPENILLDKKGRVKIADFGIAKIMGREANVAIPETKHAVGTPHYMAPEQVEKPQTVDHRADIFSLGVVFYEMLTGELPLGKFAPPSRKVQMDVRLDEIVMRALEKEPELRYQQASQVKTDVETIRSTDTDKEARRSGEEQTKQLSASASWGTWSPFQSSEVREICAHFTKTEKTEAAFRAVLYGVWVTFATFGSFALIAFFPAPYGWMIASVIVLLHVVCIPTWLRMQRQFLGSTAWAKTRGIAPEPVKLFSFGKGDVWKGIPVLLAVLLLIFAVQKLSELYDNRVPDLIPQQKQNAVAPRQAETSPAIVGPAFMPSSQQMRRAEIAIRDVTSGALVGTLPGGGTVELLAVSEENDKAIFPESLHAWWLPDGSPIPEMDYGVLRFSGAVPPRKCFIVRWRDLPNGASGPAFDSESETADWGGGAVTQNGRVLDNANYLRAAFPSSATKTTFRLGFGLDSWRTLSIYDGNGQLIANAVLPGVSDLQTQVVQIGERNGLPQVTLLIGTNRDWNVRVVGMAPDGVEHVYVRRDRNRTIEDEVSPDAFPGTDKVTHWFDIAGSPGGPPVKEFRLQARPLHWVEFRDIALRPRDKTH